MTKSYNIETLTIEELKELIFLANDEFSNQIRVKENGEVFISTTVGADNIEGLRFRFETYDAGNEYVGEKAANDTRYVEETYNNLKDCWNKGRKGYIDYFKHTKS